MREGLLGNATVGGVDDPSRFSGLKKPLILFKQTSGSLKLKPE